MRDQAIIKTVLANLKSQGLMSGYELYQALTDTFGLSLTAVYTLLHDLEGEELLKSNWHWEDGRDRKYYLLNGDLKQGDTVKLFDNISARFKNGFNHGTHTGSIK